MKSADECVSFMRFVRPPSETCEKDSKRGVTFAINVNYTKRNIEYAYSCCNGDNFDKLVGTEIAVRRFMAGKTTTIPMHTIGMHPYSGSPTKIISDHGVVWDIIDYVGFDSFEEIARAQLMEVYPDLI